MMTEEFRRFRPDALQILTYYVSNDNVTRALTQLPLPYLAIKITHGTVIELESNGKTALAT